MIRFQCSQCGKTINAADENVGKKCKCPSCQQVMVIPNQSASANPVRAADAESGAPRQAPRSSAGPKQPGSAIKASPDPEERGGSGSRSNPKAAPVPARKRARDEEDDYEDEDEEDDRPRKRKRRPERRGQWADCPNCGEPGNASRVGFTLWGGLVGPWLLTHVRCNNCGNCYNGKSGKSNTTAIILYVTIPTVIALGFIAVCGILGALGGN